MSEPHLVTTAAAAPSEAAPPLDLQITAGMTCLLGNDQPLCIAYQRMLAGLAPAQRGSVALLGSPLRKGGDGGHQLRRRVGYVTPQAPLLSVLDGVRNVMLPALYHGIAAEAEVAERARRLIEEMALAGDPRALPAFMPELQRRMLLIARALILEPELLFIEQPLAGLDSESRDRLCDYICGAVGRRVRGLVISSNDPLLASVAGQLVFIGRGRPAVFTGWAALVASGEREVQEFLERERRFCSVLQD